MRSRALVLFLLAPIAAPLLMPYHELVHSPEAWSVLLETDRVSGLFLNSLQLACSTVALSLPLGILIALLLNCSHLRGREWLRFGIWSMLFIPLPLYLVAWQAAFGIVGIRPWSDGLFSAAQVHALASLPWVVFLVGEGLRRVEPELEEHAMMSMSGFAVAWRVSLRRAAPWVMLAGLWVIVQTTTEIVVTDMLLVRTFAEEVYTQFVTSSIGAASALVIHLPVLVGGCVLGWWIFRKSPLSVTVQPLSEFRPTPTLITIPWLFRMAFLLVILFLVGLPILGLISKLRSSSASYPQLGYAWWIAVKGQLGIVIMSLLETLMASTIALLVAIPLAWHSQRNDWWQRLVIGMAILAWITPGPLLGIGMKSFIESLMDIESILLPVGWPNPVSIVLYEQANPIPVLWVHVVRLFPFALALSIVAFATIPTMLIERAILCGLNFRETVRWVIWPFLRSTIIPGVLLLSLIAFGEVSASKLVQIPGYATFTQELFSQMHYGVGSTVAALGLLQLLLTYFIAGMGYLRFHHSFRGNSSSLVRNWISRSQS